MNINAPSHLNEHGYLLLEDLLSPQTLDHMRQAADQCHKEVCVWFLDQVPSILGQSLWSGPIADAIIATLGPKAVFLSVKAVCKGHVESRPSPWHQDYPYWRGSLPKYSLWLALDDATPDNGCLRVIPGSHQRLLEHGRTTGSDRRFGNRITTGLDESRAVDVPMRTGQGLLFHDLLVHASHPGQTGRSRRSLIATYRSQPHEDNDFWPNCQPLRSVVESSLDLDG